MGRPRLALRTRSARVGWAPVVAAVILTTASCGGSAAVPETAGGSADLPSRGGVLRIVEETPESLDPARVRTVYESLPVNQIFDGLVEIDPTLKPVPGLAETWTISRDGLTYTFHLRHGVRFHDGAPLTSDDVVFSVRRLLAPGRTNRSLAFSYLTVIEGAAEFAAGRRRDLSGVQSPAPDTVVIRLERPYLSFLEVLSMDGLRVVPKHVVEKVGPEAFGKHPVGTGPFRLGSWDARKIDLAANPDYFGGAPHLDGVRIEFLDPQETDAGAARFDRGEVDLFDVTTETLERADRDPRIRIHRYQELTLSFLGLLTGVPPLDDVRVRKAIAHAIDRDALVKLSPRLRRAAVGILPPGMPGFSPGTKALSHDPSTSRRLLEEAGYPGGRGLVPIRLYTTSRSSSARELLVRIRSDLADVGIRLVVIDVPWTELNRMINDHSAPAFVLAWIADLTDPDSFLRSLFESSASANYFDFFDERSDELLEAGARETNPETRAGIYREVEGHILEMAPLVPLYHTMAALAVRKNVRGFEPSPLGLAAVNLEHVWLASEPNAR